MRRGEFGYRLKHKVQREKNKCAVQKSIKWYIGRGQRMVQRGEVCGAERERGGRCNGSVHSSPTP